MGSSRLAALLIAGPLFLTGQVIEFDSGGLTYQTLTKNGVTVMFAALPTHIRDYSILQAAVQNGSKVSWTVKAEDFIFIRPDGTALAGTPARQVVTKLIEKANRGDVIKLVTTYEMTLYGLDRFKSTNGYEQRRQAAFAEVSSTKLKAAAAASAIAFPTVKLLPGQSTDGAIFYTSQTHPLGPGRLRIHTAAETFEFEVRDPNARSSP